MNQRSLYERQALASVPPLGHPTDPRQEAIFRFAKSFLVAGHGRIGCELSVGDGGLTVAMLRGLEGVRITGVDISQGRMAVARASVERCVPEGVGRVDFLCYNLDTEFDRLPSGGFDFVFAIDVMEHVFDVFQFAHHCRRILKPEGKLILRVPNVAYVRHRIGLLLGRLPVTASWFGPRNDMRAWRESYGWDGGHLHLFTIHSLRLLFDGAGLDIVRVGDPGARGARLRSLWPTLLCGNLCVVARAR